MATERTFRFLFSILLITVSVILLGLAIGWTTPLEYLEMMAMGTNERWIIGILGIAGILFGFFILRSLFKVKRQTQTKVLNTNLGKINITLNTLESMVIKVAREIHGVKEVKPIVKCTPNGIAVFLHINLVPDLNIPEVTTQLQNKVKEYFSQVAGIEVDEVRILVAKLSTESKGRVE